MPRAPKGKRSVGSDGRASVAAKNPNGEGSVYFSAPSRRSDGTVIPGRWRATYLDADGQRRVVSAATRTEAEARRVRAIARSRSAKANDEADLRTVGELTAWWLENVARHQVKASTMDSYRKFASYLVADLGDTPIEAATPRVLTAWQSRLADRLAPFTVLNCRKVCRQAFATAVRIGLLPSNPFDSVKAPPAKARKPARALTVDEARALVTAAADLRYGAAVALLFNQGWRVSEVLGLAWEDLDLERGIAVVRRASSYTPSRGMQLGTTKTSGAEGIHHLAPGVVELLKRRRVEQATDRLRAEHWQQHEFDGQAVSLVFTTSEGGLVNRQTITKEVVRAARRAGIERADLATHSGRRTVITALYADGDVDIDDIARFVGHADAATTAGYVKRLGERPHRIARQAAELLDPSIRTDRPEADSAEQLMSCSVPQRPNPSCETSTYGQSIATW